LDFVVAFNLFCKFPNLDEVTLSVMKTTLIRNSHLALCSDRLEGGEKEREGGQRRGKEGKG
jgi:dsRNA-specific ribonuclease